MPTALPLKNNNTYGKKYVYCLFIMSIKKENLLKKVDNPKD